MSEEIINRVANSALETFNLEDLYPEGERKVLDISAWLYEGIVLREKDFRTAVKNHDWNQYKNAYLAVHCSTNAIIPAWAFMLISLEAGSFTKKVVMGSLSDLETVLFSELISTLDLDHLIGKAVVIKGCAHKPVPENAYILLAQRLQPIAKSIMYGEACSSVPLFKKK